jgi:hypothetical protein
MAIRSLLPGFRLLKGSTKQPKEFASSVEFMETPKRGFSTSIFLTSRDSCIAHDLRNEMSTCASRGLGMPGQLLLSPLKAWRL